jgi:cyclophilin family peptidyl-prolyl cis-trans isomerase
MKRAMWMGIVAAVLLVADAGVAIGQAGGERRGGGTGGRAPQAPAGARVGGAPAQPSPGAGPVVVIDTVKGTIEFETYPTEAPKTVEHILALVRRNFYNGQRVHRVVPGFVVQFGDPLTRDMRKQADWGTGGSGRTVGVGEANPKRPHKLGAVALAHVGGDPGSGDSQMYIALAPQPQLNRDFTVFGQVISGMSVVQQLRMNDIIKRVSVKGETKKR